MKLKINMMLLAFTAEKTEARKEKEKTIRLDDKLFFGREWQWYMQVKVSRRQFIPLKSGFREREQRETVHQI